MFNEKAQIHTLEGVAASLLMLLVIAYAIETTSVTGSNTNVHVENELRSLGHDILNVLDFAEPGDSSNLKKDIAGWDGRQYIWSGTDYIEKGSGNITNRIPYLSGMLESALAKQGIAHNVEMVFLKTNADNTTSPSILRIIYNGEPSHNAVIVSRKLVLHDTDNISISSPVRDIDPSTGMYNIVEVRLVMWRM